MTEKRLVMADAAKQTVDQFQSTRIADELQVLYREIKEERRRANGKDGNAV